MKPSPSPGPPPLFSRAKRLQAAPISGFLFYKDICVRLIEDEDRLKALAAGELELALSCGTWPKELTHEHLGWDRYSAINRHLLGQVSEIFIGPSKAPTNVREVDTRCPELLNKDWFGFFPKLRALHLWHLPRLKRVQQMPVGIEVLDFTGCARLQVLLFPNDRLEQLETLDLRGCDSLEDLPAITRPLQLLRYLYLERCERLSVEPLLSFLSNCPSLRELDLIEMPQIGELGGKHLPRTLRRLRINGCRNLAALPKLSGHDQLYRMELNGCEGLEALPAFPNTVKDEAGKTLHGVDYLDLSGTRKLKDLPEEARSGRTLFLNGSGIQMPPACEHGQPGENVAERTRGFFEDIEVFGRGRVRRCKVLFLGNGGADRASLCKALITGQSPTKEKGRTQGIQLWDYTLPKAVGKADAQNTRVQFWDFGDQDICYNAHRLFISTGSVFVLLWNPDEGAAPKERKQKEDAAPPLPLHIWLDLIHDACPHSPRILLVCSHRTGESPELRETLRRQLPEKYRGMFAGDSDWYFVESEGELKAFQGKLYDTIQAVVESQGATVPANWELAQHMVEGWFQPVGKGETQKPGEPTFKRRTPEEFWGGLKETIRKCAKDPSSSHHGLAKGISKVALKKLDKEEAGNRTLEFLTRSGFIFWSGALHSDQVIVDPQWALDGIYAALDRRRNSDQCRWLCDKDGRFTKSELAERVWNKEGEGNQYKPDDQDRMILLMLRLGLIFTLTSQEWPPTPNSLFISVAHLPDFEALSERRTNIFPPLRAPSRIAERTVGRAFFHPWHWHRILVKLGERYGAYAHYAKDGFMNLNSAGQVILLRFQTDSILAGAISHVGRVKIQVEQGGWRGAADERAEELAAFVESCLGDNTDPVSDPAKAGDGAIHGPAGAGWQGPGLPTLDETQWVMGRPEAKQEAVVRGGSDARGGKAENPAVRREKKTTFGLLARESFEKIDREEKGEARGRALNARQLLEKRKHDLEKIGVKGEGDVKRVRDLIRKGKQR